LTGEPHLPPPRGEYGWASARKHTGKIHTDADILLERREKDYNPFRHEIFFHACFHGR
jgi:hypothetical protein